MADPPSFESPIVRSYPPAGGAALTLADQSAATKVLVRAARDTPAATALAVPHGSSRRAGQVLILGQRPDEWLLVGTPSTTASLVGELDLAGHVNVIDLTHGRALLRLAGPDSHRTLEKICSLDWSDAMTPDGSVVSASVAKTGCDVTRQDLGTTRSYLIACDRSFGQYLFDAVLDAGDEFGIAVGAAAGAAF